MTSRTPSESSPLPGTAPGNGWLAIATMLTDLAFETDPLGRFTGFGPGQVLGQPATRLLGVEVASLLAKTEDTALSSAQFRSIITTICMECVAWHGRVRLALPGGGSGMFRLSLAPRFSARGVSGTYGILFDLEAPDLLLPERHFSDAQDPALGHNHRLDSETGLWSSRTFREEISRRLDRLDVENLPGTLLYIGFNGAPATLHRAIAMRLSEELRDIVRPTDLLGRVDATTIALWCDGMDHLTGGERAAKFCKNLPPVLPEHTRVMVGVAPRWPGSGEDPAAVTEHAIIALRLANLAGGQGQNSDPANLWRVWQRD